ncbi:MAG: AAA family ATPase [SAR324 cluster bacterium]|nr:AAA family ATPase [SAR324 cluster bacterium]
MDLFDHAVRKQSFQNAPLAARLRPRSLDEFFGQESIIGPGRLLRRAIESDRLFSSIILWGPPGTGKTTLAQIIANSSRAYFQMTSAILSGKADLRQIILEAQERSKFHSQSTLLFVDEVHRWNKAQQDALLPHVEDGTVTFIGATTENPYFEVNSALVSRSRIFQLKSLEEPDLQKILHLALTDEERGYGKRNIQIDEIALSHLVNVAGGDARNALNALEMAVESTPPAEGGQIQINLEIAQESIQQRALLYDKDGDAHYDTISAFIKSVRGSDPDAALYWLAKMIYAGESPRFILRRLLILAGEDIGLASPMGLLVANAAAQSFEYVGMPEGIYSIVEATLYLATAPKSNSASAYFTAFAQIEKEGHVEVPDHLKDPSRDGKALGHGKAYVYPHDHPDHHTGQQYLPDALVGNYFYTPSSEGHESAIKDRLFRWREAQESVLNITRSQTLPELNDSEISRIKQKIAKHGKN